MSILSKSPQWTLTGLIVIGASTYVLFWFLPKQNDLKDLQKVVDQKQEFVVEAMSFDRRVDSLRRRLVEVQSFTKLWRSKAPRTNEFVHLLSSISEHASQSGALLQRMKPMDAVSRGVINEVPIAIECRGTFHEVFDFARRLEDMAANLCITDWRISTSGEDGGNVQCEFGLMVFADNHKKTG